MHGKITRYLGKITRYLRLESASRVTAESAVAPAVTALSRPSLHSLINAIVPTRVAESDRYLESCGNRKVGVSTRYRASTRVSTSARRSEAQRMLS